MSALCPQGHCVVLEKYQDMLSIIDAQSGERYNVEEYSMPEYNIKAWKTMENLQNYQR